MDLSDFPELEDVIKLLNEGKTVPPVTVRDFLSWFGAQRRTRVNVDFINKKLEECGITTVPNYLDIWIDNSITFELSESQNLKSEAQEISEFENLNAEEERLEHSLFDDPSFKIAKIIAPGSAPMFVKPNASLEEAVTIMMARNFSQIPVMTNERTVKGVVSWRSIGARSAAKIYGEDVQAYMDEHREISASGSLFDAIKIIRESGYVLVRSSENMIIGIVTASDIAHQFEVVSTPFLLLAEIENHLRSIISKKLTVNDIKSACEKEYLPEVLSSASDLTFGNLVKILDFDKNWFKLNLNLDRVSFCKELYAINRIRNDVMHFDPDPITEHDVTKLRNMSKLFENLRSMGAF